MNVKLVRHGEDTKLANGDHLRFNVYTEMLLQICREYTSLPDPRTLQQHEIIFFYNGIRDELKKATKKGQ